MAEDPHPLSILLGATTPLHSRSRMPAGTGRPKGASRCGMGLRPTLHPSRPSRIGRVVESDQDCVDGRRGPSSRTKRRICRLGDHRKDPRPGVNRTRGSPDSGITSPCSACNAASTWSRARRSLSMGTDRGSVTGHLLAAHAVPECAGSSSRHPKVSQVGRLGTQGCFGDGPGSGIRVRGADWTSFSPCSAVTAGAGVLVETTLSPRLPPSGGPSLRSMPNSHPETLEGLLIGQDLEIIGARELQHRVLCRGFLS